MKHAWLAVQVNTKVHKAKVPAPPVLLAKSATQINLPAHPALPANMLLSIKTHARLVPMESIVVRAPRLPRRPQKTLTGVILARQDLTLPLAELVARSARLESTPKKVYPGQRAIIAAKVFTSPMMPSRRPTTTFKANVLDVKWANTTKKSSQLLASFVPRGGFRTPRLLHQEDSKALMSAIFAESESECVHPISTL